MKNKKLFWIYSLSAICYFLQGFEGLPSLSLFKYFKEVLMYPPEKLMILNAIIGLAWIPKILWGYFVDQFFDDFFVGLDITVQDIPNGICRDCLMSLSPAVIISGTGNNSIADFCFPCQLGFRKCGHTDNIRPPGTVEVGFGSGGKGRSFHNNVSAAPVNGGTCFLSCFIYNLAQHRAERLGKGNVYHDVFPEKGVDSITGAVNELVGDKQVAGLKFFFQAANGVGGDDVFYLQ